MSHVVQIRTVPILDTAALAAACEEMGGKLTLNKKTYTWYGRSVGDYKLPAGMTAEDLGKCEHAAKFDGLNYEVGFAKSKIEGEDGLYPIFDFWGSSRGGHDGKLLQDIVGEGAGRLMQSYSKHAAINAASLMGYQVSGCTTDAQGNIHLEMLVM